MLNTETVMHRQTEKINPIKVEQLKLELMNC